LEANGSRGGANKAKKAEERTFPTKTKAVVDEVNLLSAGTRKDITELIIKNGDDKVLPHRSISCEQRRCDQDHSLEQR
jgi:hypothetical protein